MEKLFTEYLEHSEKMRTGYRKSMLPAPKYWKDILSEVMDIIPEIFEVIYGNVSGTFSATQEQNLLDFTPGYLLIHISEYQKACKDLSAILTALNIKDKFYPILRDYSSHFIAIKATTGEIYLISSEDGESLLHNSSLKFLETLNDFYSKGVYFLDEDGFLDYDYDLEGEVGLKHNPGVKFWVDA
ncbi:MAG: SMI1/KNR4 family protein [Spirochaetes bacterium]|nr:SMI1/KNR4 family protein [Spirochaetota bacterium]